MGCISSQHATDISDSTMNLLVATAMETANKNSEATDTDKVSFDIVKRFPTLLCKYVFQHLDGKELVEMSAVNKKWNKLVGEELKFVINREPTHATEGILMKSKRNYQNIEISISLDNSDFVLSFLARKTGSWKFVEIMTCEPIEEALWIKMLEIVEPSVEELNIIDLFHTEQSRVAPNWTFPCLEDLKCAVHRWNIYKYFGHVSSLVSIQYSQTTKENQAAVWGILHNNKNLKKVFGAVAVESSLEQIPKLEFKLQELTITSFGTDFTQALSPFLETQALTLESLATHNRLDQTHLEFIFRMPSLTRLIFLGSISGEIQELPVNTTITTLVVQRGFLKEEQIASLKVIKALKDLKHLECGTIDSRLLLFLALNVPALEVLKVVNFNIPRLPEKIVFPNMKTFRILQEVTSEMQEPTGDNNFAELVRKELRRLSK